MELNGKQIKDGSVSASKLEDFPNDATKVLAGDGSWTAPASAGGASPMETITANANRTFTTAELNKSYYITSLTNGITFYLPTANVPDGSWIEFVGKNKEVSYSPFINISTGSETYKMDEDNRMTFVCSGNAWESINRLTENTYSNYNYGVGIGYSAYNNYKYGVGIGYNAKDNSNHGVGIGYNAYGNYNGVGIGKNAISNYNNGVGIGNSAYGNYNGGVGIGYNASCSGNGDCTVALGAYSQADRNREIVSGSDNSTNYKSKYCVQKWKYNDLSANGDDDDTWQEIFIDGSGTRMTMNPNSLYKFRMQIILQITDELAHGGQNYPVYGEELIGTVAYDENRVGRVLAQNGNSGSGTTAGTTCYCTDTNEANTVPFISPTGTVGGRVREWNDNLFNTYSPEFKIDITNAGIMSFMVRLVHPTKPSFRITSNWTATEHSCI